MSASGRRIVGEDYNVINMNSYYEKQASAYSGSNTIKCQ